MMTTELIGLLAGICTTVSYMPQAVKTLRTRNVDGLSLPMYVLLNIGMALWFTYGVALGSWPVMLANGISLVPTMLTLMLLLRLR